MTEEKNTPRRLSRKDFVKGAAAVAGAGALAGCAPAAAPVPADTPAPCPTCPPAEECPSPAWLPEKWDFEADVVVVGTGFAGQAAAIEASDAGAAVLMLEKSPREHWGGGSAANVTYSHALIGTSAEAAIEHMRAMCWGTVADDEVIVALAEGNQELPEWLEGLGATIKWKHKATGFPNIPGGETYGGDIEGDPEVERYDFDALPPEEYLQMKEDGLVESSWQEFMGDVFAARGIEVMFNTPATELIQDGATKEILGLKALTGVEFTEKFEQLPGGEEIYIKAKKGVVMATGDYSHNREMLRQFSRHAHSSYITSYNGPYNTGEGIIMAQKVGAKLWHMNAFDCHAYASTVASKEIGTGVCVNAWADDIAKGPGIIVNRDGKRFMDEYHVGAHTCLDRAYERFEHALTPDDDYDYSDYRNCPFYWIFDDTTMKAGKLGQKGQFVAAANLWKWSDDNLAELAKGWFIQADTIEELGKKTVVKDFWDRIVGMDAAGLVETVTRYNEYCAAGNDEDFGRRPTTMAPLITPPFYAMEVCECQTKTSGGPQRNKFSQTLDALGQPIPRLYNAGGNGSIWGFLYNGGEGIPEASTTGRIAGKHAAALEPWSA